MTARSVTQLENAYIPALPERSTLERLESLFVNWRREEVIIDRKRLLLTAFDRKHSLPEDQAADRRNEIINQVTQAELRRTSIEREIYNVARLLVAEADAEVE